MKTLKRTNGSGTWGTFCYAHERAGQSVEVQATNDYLREVAGLKAQTVIESTELGLEQLNPVNNALAGLEARINTIEDLLQVEDKFERMNAFNDAMDEIYATA